MSYLKQSSCVLCCYYISILHSLSVGTNWHYITNSYLIVKYGTNIAVQFPKSANLTTQKSLRNVMETYIEGTAKHSVNILFLEK